MVRTHACRSSYCNRAKTNVSRKVFSLPSLPVEGKKRESRNEINSPDEHC